jgi:hypothetical protein
VNCDDARDNRRNYHICHSRMLDIDHTGHNNHNIVHSSRHDYEHNMARELNSADLNSSALLYAANAYDAFDKLFVHDESWRMHPNAACCGQLYFAFYASVYE